MNTKLILVLIVLIFFVACWVVKNQTTTSVQPPIVVPISSVGEWQVTFVDVGQGDATFIHLENYTMLIDCGDNGMGSRTIDLARKKNITYINVLVATHQDSDHIGGCDEIMQAIPVGIVIDNGDVKDTKTYRDFKTEAEKTQYRHSIGDEVLSSSISLYAPYSYATKWEDENENSLIIKINAGNESFLITGDCEKDCESALVAKHPTELKSDIMKAGHHGSRTSNSQALLDKVKPTTVVISAAKVNKYGHPHAETINRLNAMGIKILTTFDNGNVVFGSNN